MSNEPRDPLSILTAVERVVERYGSLARSDPDAFSSLNFDDVEVLADLALATGDRATAALLVHAWASHDADWRFNDNIRPAVRSCLELAPELFDDWSVQSIETFNATGLHLRAYDGAGDSTPLVVRQINRLVRSTAQLLPEQFQLHADLGGDGTLQILVADENTTGPDDPHASAGMDPEADPPTWIFSSSDGTRFVGSNLTVDASPEACAAWLVAASAPTPPPPATSRSRWRERGITESNSTERAIAREI